MQPERIATVLETRLEAEDTYFVRLAVEGSTAFEPGQFLQINCAPGEAELWRPFGILGNNPDRGEMWLLIRDRGPGSNWLSHRSKGEKISFYGPLGQGFRLDEVGSASRVLLVGEAIGVVHLAELSHRLVKQGKLVTLLATAPRNKSMPDSVFVRSFNVNYKVHTIFHDVERLAALLLQTDLSGYDAAFFSLAPRTYSQLIKEKVLGRPGTVLEQPQLFFQKIIKCGIGVCKECQVDTVDGPRLLCTDGPVFKLSDIQWHIR